MNEISHIGDPTENKPNTVPMKQDSLFCVQYCYLFVINVCMMSIITHTCISTSTKVLKKCTVFNFFYYWIFFMESKVKQLTQDIN